MAIVTFYSPFAKGNKKTWEAKAQLKVISLLINTPLDIALPKWQIW
jgi:hypothetical protein